MEYLRCNRKDSFRLIAGCQCQKPDKFVFLESIFFFGKSSVLKPRSTIEKKFILFQHGRISAYKNKYWFAGYPETGRRIP
jgi:hypothetical protein